VLKNKEEHIKESKTTKRIFNLSYLTCKIKIFKKEGKGND